MSTSRKRKRNDGVLKSDLIKQFDRLANPDQDSNYKRPRGSSKWRKSKWACELKNLIGTQEDQITLFRESLRIVFANRDLCGLIFSFVEDTRQRVSRLNDFEDLKAAYRESVTPYTRVSKAFSNLVPESYIRELIAAYKLPGHNTQLSVLVDSYSPKAALSTYATELQRWARWFPKYLGRRISRTQLQRSKLIPHDMLHDGTLTFCWTTWAARREGYGASRTSVAALCYELHGGCLEYEAGKKAEQEALEAEKKQLTSKKQAALRVALTQHKKVYPQLTFKMAEKTDAFAKFMSPSCKTKSVTKRRLALIAREVVNKMYLSDLEDIKTQLKRFGKPVSQSESEATSSTQPQEAALRSFDPADVLKLKVEQFKLSDAYNAVKCSLEELLKSELKEQERQKKERERQRADKQRWLTSEEQQTSIAEMKRMSKEGRKAFIISRLREHRLPWDNGSSLLRGAVSGEVKMGIGKIVALRLMCEYLFENGHIIYSQFQSSFKHSMDEAAYRIRGQMTTLGEENLWIQAYNTTRDEFADEIEHFYEERRRSSYHSWGNYW